MDNIFAARSQMAMSLAFHNRVHNKAIPKIGF